MENKKAILVVSFGTSHPETREKTLDILERSLAEANPGYAMYCAWTSGMIRAKLFARDGIRIFSVAEAMAQMNADGVEALIVQPTHILNGIENDLMKADVENHRGNISKIVFGDPLLTTTEDHRAALEAVMEELEPARDEALVWMGHGTAHFANAAYAALDYMLKDLGYTNAFLGTVEAYPSLENVLDQVRAYAPKRVILAPFMIVAGEHAENDLAGDGPESWKSRFEQEGYEVSVVKKGLGEYSGIREIYVSHAAAAREKQEAGNVSLSGVFTAGG